MFTHAYVEHPMVHPFECPNENADKVMKVMKDTMEQTVELNIPLIAEAAIGNNWNEAH